MHVSAIIAAGGRGTRFGAGRPKQLLALGDRTILQRSVDAFLRCAAIDEVVVALPPDLLDPAPVHAEGSSTPLRLVAGGDRRQDSVARAFAHIAAAAEVVVVHDAARPLVSDEVIRRTIRAAIEDGAAIAALRARDTVKRLDASGLVAATLPRDEIVLAQTPQAFRVGVLRDALAQSAAATDEATLAELAGHRVRVVEGDPRNLKITAPEDLELAAWWMAGSALPVIRVGNGYDLHRLVAGRRLVLGGVEIPFDRGLQGHSDADAVCHAVTDAILGAAGAGDIGRHFPDDDPAWKDANSVQLLRRAAALVRERGFTVVNVDLVIVAQRPKIAPFVDAMRQSIAAALDCRIDQVSVKGKTNEGVDSIGAGESIAVHAIALIAGGREEGRE